MTHDLQERRADAEAKLADLKSQLGAAILDGQDVRKIYAEIETWARELASVEAAINEQDRRGHAEGHEAHSKHAERVRVQTREHLENCLAAVREWEALRRALRDALDKALAEGTAAGSGFHYLSGERGGWPSCLSAGEIKRLLGSSLSGAMASQGGGPNLGPVRWLGGSLFPLDADIGAYLERQLTPHLELLERKANGTSHED